MVSYQTIKLLGSAAMMIFLYQDIEKMGLLPAAHALFFVAQISSFAICAYMYLKVTSSKELEGLVHVPAVVQFGQEVSPSQTISTKEYDLTKCKHQAVQVLLGSGLCYVMYHKLGYVIPLAMQIVMLPLGTLESPVAQVHVFGRAARGNLKRPWPQPNMFAGPLGMLEEVKKESKKKLNEAKKGSAAGAGKSSTGKKKGK
mmetsp:Transcript_60396/g.112117  ORF Transcript_60396/g.112117 Transcript_60396/m.112117 type:complete len:200 (+) Transcript_60396:178-777(+)